MKRILEMLARTFIVVLILGMTGTVYSNHNPAFLEENQFILRIISFVFIGWIIIPLYELIKERLKEKKK